MLRARVYFKCLVQRPLKKSMEQLHFKNTHGILMKIDAEWEL